MVCTTLLQQHSRIIVNFAEICQLEYINKKKKTTLIHSTCNHNNNSNHYYYYYNDIEINLYLSVTVFIFISSSPFIISAYYYIARASRLFFCIVATVVVRYSIFMIGNMKSLARINATQSEKRFFFDGAVEWCTVTRVAAEFNEKLK